MYSYTVEFNLYCDVLGTFSELIFSLNFISIFPCHYMCNARQSGEFRAAQKKIKTPYFSSI